LRARARIVARVRRATFGNFGDCKPVGEGVSEMPVDVCRGYRLYFIRKGAEVYLLLVGGDKSTQKRDIERAMAMARKLREQGQ
jgi:putative addiction module killer protein